MQNFGKIIHILDSERSEEDRCCTMVFIYLLQNFY